MTRSNKGQATIRRRKQKARLIAKAIELSPWLTASELAGYTRVGIKTIYKEAKSGRLRSAVVGGRKALRFRTEWGDEFLERTASPVEVKPPRRVA